MKGYPSGSGTAQNPAGGRRPPGCPTAGIRLGGSPQSAYTLTRAEQLKALDGLLQAQSFDVLLLDLHLPDSQGLATVSQAHEPRALDADGSFDQRGR